MWCCNVALETYQGTNLAAFDRFLGPQHALFSRVPHAARPVLANLFKYSHRTCGLEGVTTLFWTDFGQILGPNILEKTMLER